jgi:hypothetical protein
MSSKNKGGREIRKPKQPKQPKQAKHEHGMTEIVAQKRPGKPKAT